MESLFNACFVRSRVVFSCLRVWFIESSSTLFLCSLFSVLWSDQLCLSFTLAQSFSDFSFIIFLSYSLSLPPHTCNLFLIIICSLFHIQAPILLILSHSLLWSFCDHPLRPWISAGFLFLVPFFVLLWLPAFPVIFFFCSLLFIKPPNPLDISAQCSWVLLQHPTQHKGCSFFQVTFSLTDITLIWGLVMGTLTSSQDSSSLYLMSHDQKQGLKHLNVWCRW